MPSSGMDGLPPDRGGLDVSLGITVTRLSRQRTKINQFVQEIDISTITEYSSLGAIGLWAAPTFRNYRRCTSSQRRCFPHASRRWPRPSSAWSCSQAVDAPLAGGSQSVCVETRTSSVGSSTAANGHRSACRGCGLRRRQRRPTRQHRRVPYQAPETPDGQLYAGAGRPDIREGLRGSNSNELAAQHYLHGRTRRLSSQPPLGRGCLCPERVVLAVRCEGHAARVWIWLAHADRGVGLRCRAYGKRYARRKDDRALPGRYPMGRVPGAGVSRVRGVDLEGRWRIVLHRVGVHRHARLWFAR